MSLKQSTLVLQEKAKQLVNELNQTDKERLANKHKNYTIWTNAIFGVLSALMAVVMIVLVFNFVILEDSFPDLAWFLIFLCVVCAISSINLFIEIKQTLGKSTEELALRATIKNLKTSGVATTVLQQSKIKDPDFLVAKTIPIYDSGWGRTNLLIDIEHKRFVYHKGKKYSKIYNFSDIINYEIYENGKSKVQGRAGSSIIGGAFFGLGGAIAGSSRSRTIDEKCNQLKLIIHVNDFDCPQIEFIYISNVDYDKSGMIYRNMRNNLQLICSQLEYMINANTLEQSAFQMSQHSKDTTSKSKKEQLQELKEMLDDGLITQEDYEQKKKQIIGL